MDLAIWQDEYGAGDPATIQVTGGAFADPFDPGTNQSMVLHNPNGSAQMSVTWVDEFMDDPSTFRNGTIEFDMWMDSPDPDAFWTFLGVRVGHGDETRSAALPTSSDMTVWNTFRMQNQGEPPDPIQVLEQVTDPGHRIGLGVEPTYNDDNSDPNAGAFGPDQAVSVRFEIAENGYSLQDLPNYRLFLNDNQIEWTGTAVGDSMEHPWVFGPGLTLQPGINVLTFITDASAFGSNSTPGTGNVYIDNLVITNNDLPPLSGSAAVPEPTSIALLSALVLLHLAPGTQRFRRRT